MEDKISNYVTGYRKSHGTQHSLVIMLERWKQAIDKGEYISVMYMNLSKAFDTINHDLLLAKLRAYGFSASVLNLLYSYLKYRKQKVVINNKTSSSEVVMAGVPQVSIDGPLLFNLFIDDLILFLYTTVLSNYADDNNLYAIGNDKEKTKRALVKDFQTVINWFYENYMVLKNAIICVWVKMWRKTKLCKFRVNKKVEIDKNRSKIIISPTYRKHFQESRPKTKCIIENLPIP